MQQARLRPHLSWKLQTAVLLCPGISAKTADPGLAYLKQTKGQRTTKPYVTNALQ